MVASKADECEVLGSIPSSSNRWLSDRKRGGECEILGSIPSSSKLLLGISVRKFSVAFWKLEMCSADGTVAMGLNNRVCEMQVYKSTPLLKPLGKTTVMINLIHINTYHNTLQQQVSLVLI